MTNNGSKKTCATCDRLDGSICKLDRFCIGSIETGTCEKYKQRPSSVDNEKNGARQAITDNERREIATRLRRRRKEMDNEKPRRFYRSQRPSTCWRFPPRSSSTRAERFFNRLADLIDRETCTFDGTPDRIGYVCSNCGQTFTRRPFMKRTFGGSTQFEIPFRFCPYCGAEVVTDDE